MLDKKNLKTIMIKRIFLIIAFLTLCMNVFTQNDVIWKKNFGGNSYDDFLSITAVWDGMIAVGYSRKESFENGDWLGIHNKGNLSDAIIVKYDNYGNVIWRKNFGGKESSKYYSVVAVSGGYIAVGYSNWTLEVYRCWEISYVDDEETERKEICRYAFPGGADWYGTEGKGGNDAIIVKYDHNGNVVWKKSFGGNNDDSFFSVTEVSDGIIAAGFSEAGSFRTGDWENTEGKGGNDAIIVKFDHNGKVVWKKNFGGGGGDCFYSTMAVRNGIIAVGVTLVDNTGDWALTPSRETKNAMAVKYDLKGNVIWKKHIGGDAANMFNSVSATPNGCIAVGYAWKEAFETEDWKEVPGKGEIDAIMVQYDLNGNVVWKNNFGGKSNDYFYGVTSLNDGFVAVGYSDYASFNTGDWLEVMPKNDCKSGILVKFDYNGNVIWKKNFGGTVHESFDIFNAVIAVSDGIVTVGNAMNGFNTGDWLGGVKGKGQGDGIIVKFNCK